MCKNEKNGAKIRLFVRNFFLSFLHTAWNCQIFYKILRKHIGCGKQSLITKTTSTELNWLSTNVLCCSLGREGV
jgi:hypothetical protein